MNTEVCGISRTAKEAQLLKEDGKKAILLELKMDMELEKI
jgi:hypothetical protein